jgi:hypothetical protein
MLRDINPGEPLAGVLLTQRTMGYAATAARPCRFPDLGLSGHRRLNVAGNGLQNNFAFDVGATRPRSSR